MSTNSIIIEKITPLASIVTTNIIICRRNIADEELIQLSQDLEIDVQNSRNETEMQPNVIYAIQTELGWRRVVVKFTRAKDKVSVLQFIDFREKPIDFCTKMKVRKLASAHLCVKKPALFKIMIYGLGTYVFDDEYYMIFDQLFKDKQITGLFTLLEPKPNIVHECYVGDLFWKVGQKLLSMRELLIRERISYPSRVRTNINQRILLARTNFLSRVEVTLPSPIATSQPIKYDTSIAVIGERINIFEILGEGTVCSRS